jgi:RNA polymerase sigma-70 factor (ECF subfamily)
VQSDGEIVRAVLAGDRAAYAALVERYGRLVRATALSVLRDMHAAEDIEQEAFLTAYRKLATLRSGEQFGPWLMIITRRLALDGLRLRRRRRVVPLDPRTDQVPAPTNGRLAEDLEPLLDGVMRLPMPERHVVMLRYFAGYSVQRVADTMSCPVGTVTKQLWRARQRLRDWLKEVPS